MNNAKLCQQKNLIGKNEQERFALLSKSILNDDGNIMFAGQLLRSAVLCYPDNIALIYQDRKISYPELYHRVLLFAEKLIAQGVKPRDRVLLFFQNSLEFYIAYYAVWEVGGVVAPLNIFLHERELNHIARDADPVLILTATDKKEFFSGDHLPPILTEEDMNIDGPLNGEKPEIKVSYPASDELAVLLYTSGTTGFPKGVMLSSKNIMTNVAQIMSVVPFSESQRIFCVLPLFHSFAQNTCVWSSIFSGCTVIVVPKIERRAILQNLKHKPTIFLGVPALYGLLCLLKTAPLSSVDYFVCGGDALPDKIRTAFEMIYRRKLCNGYGLTETSPLISVDLDDVIEPTNNVGRPVIGVEYSLRDSAGKELPKTEIGVLWVKGDNIMMGYYNAPEKTKEVLQDGWFCTGDLATVDANGKLLICGRDKDLIINKGLNIYPQEIENIIFSHMAVLYVGVIGKPDESQGEVPIAFVQLQRGRKEDGLEQELLALCKKNLAVYKIPRRFIFITDMPLTATNKVDKKVLRVRIEPA